MILRGVNGLSKTRPRSPYNSALADAACAGYCHPREEHLLPLHLFTLWPGRQPERDIHFQSDEQDNQLLSLVITDFETWGRAVGQNDTTPLGRLWWSRYFCATPFDGQRCLLTELLLCSKSVRHQ